MKVQAKIFYDKILIDDKLRLICIFYFLIWLILLSTINSLTNTDIFLVFMNKFVFQILNKSFKGFPLKNEHHKSLIL